MKIKHNLWIPAIIVGVVVLTRLIPHYPNFTAMGGAALFSGAFLSRRYAFLIPVIALFVSDLLLNNLLYAHQLPGQETGFVLFQPMTLWTYGALIGIVLLGDRCIRSTRIIPVIGTSLGASVLFFLVTNFAVWINSIMYPKTLAGLGAAYAAGLPFFGNTVTGDLFFVSIFFGGLVWMRKSAPHLVPMESRVRQ